MKIGILTFHYAYNYGALLQAYGLQEELRNFGHTVKFINYTPGGKNRRWWRGWGIRRGRYFFPASLKRLRFDMFRNRYLQQTPLCKSKEMLPNIALDFDALIVGSDQVWNGNAFSSFDESYFLNFVDSKKCRKISYAACFGTPVQPPDTMFLAGDFLKEIDYLSVRNEISARLVKDLSERIAELVLDPTLLHDYEKLNEEKKFKGEYIAAYFLNHANLPTGLDILKRIKNNLKMPIVIMGLDKRVDFCDFNYLSAGPKEWINVIRNSSFVCTNSLHGTIFAIKYRKPFVSWSSNSLDGTRGSGRLHDFLKNIGLEDRLIYNSEVDNILKLLSSTIDYREAYKKLTPLVQKSFGFLRSSLRN